TDYAFDGLYFVLILRRPLQARIVKAIDPPSDTSAALFFPVPILPSVVYRWTASCKWPPPCPPAWPERFDEVLPDTNVVRKDARREEYASLFALPAMLRFVLFY